MRGEERPACTQPRVELRPRVLFELEGDEPRYIDGDDDSGYSTNARIEERLYRGREYVLRVRLYYSDIQGQTAVFMY